VAGASEWMSSTPTADGGTGPGKLVVARIGRPHGLRGEVTVEVRTDDPDSRFAPGAVLETDPSTRGPLTVDSSRNQSGLTVVRFRGYEDRNAAETLRGTLLLVDATALPELTDDDDFYDHDLIGLSAVLVGESEPFGTVTDVLHLPASDVLEVRTDRSAAGEVLIPFVRAIVPDVDLAAGRLTVAAPDGLFD
jgi:16S rRNA processing protein RimM